MFFIAINVLAMGNQMLFRNAYVDMMGDVDSGKSKNCDLTTAR